MRGKWEQNLFKFLQRLHYHTFREGEASRHRKEAKAHFFKLIYYKSLNALKYGGDNDSPDYEKTENQLQSQKEPTENEAADKELEKELRFLVSTFIVKHQLPHMLSSELISLLKDIVTKYNAPTILNTTLSRTTCTEIIQSASHPH